MNKRLFSCVLLFLSFPMSVFACLAPPAHMIVDHEELVHRTETIVLAKALGGSDDTAKVWKKQHELMQFERLELLKGRTPLHFTIPNGFILSQVMDVNEFGGGSYETDFDRHRDPRFWKKKWARQWNEPDCALRPTFTVGNTYLLFLGTPHWQGYERIETNDDVWLETVRKLVRRTGE